MATPSGTGINWSHIAAPSKQQQSHQTKPSPPPQPQSRSSNNRTKNRKNRKKRQKQGKQQWPTLNANNNQNQSQSNNNSPNKSQTNNNKNGSVSFAALTSKSQKFAPTANPYDTMLISSASASSYHTNYTHNTHNSPPINKQELQKIEQQRQSALNTLKKQYIDNGNLKDIFCSNNINIYGVRNRGICNRNVDCYINAIIQSILSLPLVITIFSNIKNAKTAANIGSFAKALYDIIHLFNISSQASQTSQHRNRHKNNNMQKKQLDSINYNDTTYSKINHPKSLISILDKFRYSIGRLGHGQQDAQEFLGYVITNLHDEMIWNKKKDINESNQAQSVCSNQASKQSKHKNENKKENNDNNVPRLTRKQRKALREKQQQNKNENKNENKNDNKNDNNTAQRAREREEEEKKEENMDNGWKLVTKNIHHKASVAHKLKMNESLISMLFGGEYYQIIRSHGKSKKSPPSVGYQPFFSVSLDIHDNKIKTVSSALQHHFSKPHVISYKNGYANKSELISETPYYLILHLKRFLFEDGHIYKLHKYIGYDTKLTVPQHLLFDKNTMKTPINTNKLRYELRSVIVHEGDFVTHGHYISYCRREDFYINKINKNRTHQWILFNDDKVEGPIHINTLKTQQAYVLIYQKML